MKRKFVKNVLNNCQNNIHLLELIKRRPGISLVASVLIILLALRNPFVIGAILGGFLGVKKVEKIYKQHEFHDMPVIIALITGSILGGLFVISMVAGGNFFLGDVGGFSGAIIGTLATAVFAGCITERIVGEVMSVRAFGNKTKLKMHAMLKKTRKTL